MPGCEKPLWSRLFSHVYVEQDAYAYPLTRRVLDRLRNATVIPITRYEDIFNRKGQDFNIQKHTPKLLLAVNRGIILRPGAEVCDHFGHTRFFYATQMMNCVYDCEYCYLRGMYASANMVAFVNTADYLTAVDNALPAYVSISYDADLLAVERLFGFVAEWIKYAAKKPSLTLEIRTKSADAAILAGMQPTGNVILAWTISPETDAARFEKKAPSLIKRVTAMRAAMENGWNVRLCADPILLTDGWEPRMHVMADIIKSNLNVRKLYDVSIGGFRVSTTYYKRMRRINPASIIFTLPLAEQNGVMAYEPETETALKTHLVERLYT